MESTTGLYLPIDIISLENDKQAQEGSKPFLCQEEKLQEFIELCVSRIRGAAESGFLAATRTYYPSCIGGELEVPRGAGSLGAASSQNREQGQSGSSLLCCRKRRPRAWRPCSESSLDDQDGERREFVPSALVGEKIRDLGCGKANGARTESLSEHSRARSAGKKRAFLTTLGDLMKMNRLMKKCSYHGR